MYGRNGKRTVLGTGKIIPSTIAKLKRHAARGSMVAGDFKRISFRGVSFVKSRRTRRISRAFRMLSMFRSISSGPRTTLYTLPSCDTVNKYKRSIFKPRE